MTAPTLSAEEIEARTLEAQQQQLEQIRAAGKPEFDLLYWQTRATNWQAKASCLDSALLCLEETKADLTELLSTLPVDSAESHVARETVLRLGKRITRVLTALKHPDATKPPARPLPQATDDEGQ